jgi:hypothetical protein
MSPDYSTRYSSDKISYYKSLGKKHVSDVDDSSTDNDSDSSSDDFPSPEPQKKRGGNDHRDPKEDKDEVEKLRRKIKELEGKRK